MRAALVVAVFTVVGLVATLVPAGAGSTVHDSQPVESPSADTPRVNGGGHVDAVLEFGDRVLVAGQFTGAASAGTSNLFNRSNVFVYGPGGVVDPVFDPVLNGPVLDAVAAPDGTSVFLVGSFTSVDGLPGTSRVVKLDVDTGQVVPGFTSPMPDGPVNSVELWGNELVIAGSFGFAGGRQRSRIASIDITTGQVTESVRNTFAGVWNGGSTFVKDIEIDPSGTHLVAIGNFNNVDGATRNQIAVFDLAPGSSVLDPFTAPIYSGACSNSFNTYMRDADIAPDGSYFVVVTTGAYSGGVGNNSGCDAAARWEFETGPGSTPVWLDYTGGDTLTKVEVAGPVVYVGGHQRWMNNPFAGDRVGPGAVPRDGIAAIDARNGLPLSWNPGRARGVGVYSMLATAQGLYVGSDTDIFNEQYRPRLAYVPLAGGKGLPADHVEGLPGNVYSLGQSSATNGSASNNVVKRLFDGTAVTSAETVSLPGTWSSVRGATMVDGTIYYGWSDGTFRRLDATTGTSSTVNLLGLTAFAADLDNIGAMFYDPVRARLYYTRDDTSNLFYRYFLPESQVVGAVRFSVPATPGVNWSSVRGAFLDGDDLYFGQTDGTLRRIAWDGAPTGAVTNVSGPGVDTQRWTARGLFVHTIDTAPNAQPNAIIALPTCTDLTCQFSGSGSDDPDGTITTHSWDFGDGTPAVTGATASHTYAAGGQYTVTLTVTDNRGGTASATRDVTVQPPPNQPPSAAIAAPACTDLSCTFDGSGSDDPDGTIASHSWDFGDGTTPVTGATPAHTYAGGGTFTVTLTVTDDDGGTATASTQVTVTPPPNQPPVATIGAPSCVQLVCSFDGSSSTDPDGTIAAHSWDFGDGSTDTGATVQHTFPQSGDYTVQLTVTDDDGETRSTTVQVGVTDQEPEPVAIAFRDAQTSSANATSGSVTVPASVQAGDALLLLLTYNSNTASFTQPTGTAAPWTQVASRTAGSSTTVLWQAVAQAGDAGDRVTVGIGTTAKLGLQLLAYSGTDQANPLDAFAVAVETVNRAAHTTPTVGVTDTGSWLVSLWTDKTSSTNSWTAPAGVTVRGQTTGVGGGRVTSLSGDSGGPVPAGPAGGLTATSTSNVQATMWSLVLAPQSAGTPPANNPPTALIAAPACTNRSCTFDGSGSTDADGTIQSYSWDFGDGTPAATGATAAHTYDVAGDYSVTLTVTDAAGATDTDTVPVTVSDPTPVPSSIGFVGAQTASTNSTNVQVAVPSGVQPGDALLLLATYNTTGTFAAPTGTGAAWTQVGVRTAGSSTTVLWRAVAQAGDAGANVRVDLGTTSKLGAQLLAYRGTDPSAPVGAFAADAETVARAGHTTPTVAVATPGSWLVSLWTDKTSSTDSWTAPAGVTVRGQTTGVGGGRVTSLSADSGGPVPTGTAGGLTATSTSNVQATMWSIVLVPAP